MQIPVKIVTLDWKLNPYRAAVNHNPPAGESHEFFPRPFPEDCFPARHKKFPWAVLELISLSAFEDVLTSLLKYNTSSNNGCLKSFK